MSAANMAALYGDSSTASAVVFWDGFPPQNVQDGSRITTDTPRLYQIYDIRRFFSKLAELLAQQYPFGPFNSTLEHMLLNGTKITVAYSILDSFEADSLDADHTDFGLDKSKGRGKKVDRFLKGLPATITVHVTFLTTADEDAFARAFAEFAAARAE